MKINTNLSWQYHVNDISMKLKRVNSVASKMREYVSLKILLFCYFLILVILRLSCLGSKLYFYSTNCNFTKEIARIINFQPRFSNTSPVPCLSKGQSKTCHIKFAKERGIQNVNSLYTGGWSLKSERKRTGEGSQAYLFVHSLKIIA